MVITRVLCPERVRQILAQLRWGAHRLGCERTSARGDQPVPLWEGRHD